MREKISAELGVTEARLDEVRTAPCLEVAAQQLLSFQAEVKSRLKKLILKYHPDRNPGDSSAAEKLRIALELGDRIAKLRVNPPAPPVVTQLQVTEFRPGMPRPARVYNSDALREDSSERGSYAQNGYRVVFIEPK